MNPTTRRPKIALLLLSLSLALATLPLASTSAAPSHWPGHARFVHATDDTPAEPEEPAEPETVEPAPPIASESDPPPPPAAESPPAEEPPAESAPVADVLVEIPAEVVPAESGVTTETSLAPETADPAPAIEPSESFAAASTDETEGASAAEESNQTEDAGDFTAAAVPIAVDDAATTHQPDDVVIDVLANDTDADGDPLTIPSFTQGANGSVFRQVASLTSPLTYSPNTGFVGSDTFTYTISDGADTATGTVTITVTNIPPVAGDDSATTQQPADVVIDVLANDTDGDGDALTIPSFTQGANGSVFRQVASLTSPLTYSPNAGFAGADTFTYTISDGADTAVGTVTVTVTAVNTPPVANDDSATTLHGRAVTIPVLTNDTGDSLTIDGVSAPTSNRADVVVNSDGTVTYTPDPGVLEGSPFGPVLTHGFLGPDSFTYTISDGTDTATATVNVTVTNTPPVAVDYALATAPGVPLTIDLLANNVDPDGDPLLAFAGGVPVATGSVTTVEQAIIRYDPAPGFEGEVQVLYSIWDGAANSTAFVTICVGDCDGVGNSPPVAVDDAVTTTAGTPIDIDVLANDTDSDGDDLDIPVVFPVSVPANGSAGVARTLDGSLVVYTPDVGFVGIDTFTYLVSDGEAIDTGTVTVTVLAAQENQPPVAVDDTATTTEGAPVTIDVLANDSDPDGDALTLNFVDDAANGAAVVLDPIAGALTYTPNPGFVGVDSFFYEIRDGDSSTSALVTVTVTEAPDPEPPIETPKAPKNEQPAPKQPAAKPAPKPAAVVATTLPDTGAGPFAGRDENHALLLGLLTILFAALLVLRRRLA